MAIYKYRAKKGLEHVVDGKIEAQSEKDAIEKIHQMGCIPLHIEECLRSEPKTQASSSLGARMFGRIPQSEITLFSRSLASLLRAGVPILKAISIISEQSENANLKVMLYNIYNAVKDGSRFSSALMKYPKAFSYLYVAIINAGEDSGSLPDALLRIAEYRAKQEDMLSRIRMALAYPVLMAVVGIATVVFMLTFVVPRLTNIFTSIGQALPMPTRILISVSAGLRQSWPWIILSLAIAILSVRKQLNTQNGRMFFSAFKLRFPVFGRFVFKSELARFSRTLELLIRNGIPILKAIDIAIPVLENELIKNQLRRSYKDLEQGGSFGKSLKESKLIPLFVTNLIIVGEESGRLDEALSEVANIYERETDETTKVMTNLLEPLMILITGLIVGFIVIAMLLPIFEINVVVK
ncbi:MAG: type II secretion system F family protein [Candidatus Omnitrophica bacterium]|nr:type II secretion system F family protein [Candidatus Omnitrophota bacterium]